MYKKVKYGICAPKGFTASGIHCGIRKNREKKDLSLIYSEVAAASAAVYTRNKVKGAPLIVTRKHLKNGYARAVLVNSGNANTCNKDGEEIANRMCELCASNLGIQKSDIIIASTGVIGVPLLLDPIEKGMGALVKGLSRNGSSSAVEGIMTTDSFPKELAVSFELDQKRCRIGGIAKGSGMIHPNMATMLAFMTTDVAISPKLLQKAVKEVVKESFNMISVDGDTSTNDMFTVMANGMANNRMISEENEAYFIFRNSLMYLAKELAKSLAADGEGATKLLTCKVYRAESDRDAKQIARTVVSSSLLKCAMYGKDANWGRVLCAIGYANAKVDVNRIDVSFVSKKGEIKVCENGRGFQSSKSETGVDEERAKLILGEKEVEIIIDLKSGSYHAAAWGCDLSYEYIKINGDYRS